MPMNYPVCFIYESSGSELRYVDVPDLKLKWAGANFKGQAPKEILKAVKARIERCLMEIQRLGMALPSEGNRKQYEHNEGGTNRLWTEIEVDTPMQAGILQKVMPMGAVLASFLSWLMLTFMTTFASDLTFRRYSKELSIAITVLGVITSFFVIMFINYISDARGAAAEIGRQMDNWFRKPLDEEVLRQALESDYQPLALVELEGEEHLLPIEESRPDKAPLAPEEAIEEEVDITALARQQEAARINWIKRGVGIGLGMACVLDAFVFAMVSYQSTYHMGRNAFDKGLSEELVHAIALIDTGITLGEIGFVSTGFLRRILSIVENYLLECSLESLKKARDSVPVELTAASVKSSSTELQTQSLFGVQRRRGIANLQQKVEEEEAALSSNYMALS